MISILLSTLAVAFAAFCVWLTVRIVNRRERWAKWMLAAVVGGPALYVAGFGPAMWITVRTRGRILGLDAFVMVYEPVFTRAHLSKHFGIAMDWYAKIGLPEGVTFTVSRLYFEANPPSKGVLQ
jgi:hypothetical protein